MAKSMKVGDLMATTVEFIDANATVQDAASLMGELDVSALPIGTPQDLKGVITDRDILYRVVAAGRDPRRTPVLQVATKQVYSCQPQDPLSVAMDLMASQNVRRLPVLDDAQSVIGWITLSDLSRHLLVESEVVQTALHGITDRIGSNAAEQGPQVEGDAVTK
ncbi:MAG TPA: CBS domain-containing protein [Burkholderiales bacterium]|nr:CBS domain-containing protein [Burkholderiales bacterium]